MRIGLGLPAAVPGVEASAIGDWAARSEETGFSSLAVLDRLVYDNLDPLIALTAAAARTSRVELLTTVLNVPVRRNAALVAKQIASVDSISGQRLTVGLALGGWPADYRVSEVEFGGRAAVFDDMLAAMRRVIRGGGERKDCVCLVDLTNLVPTQRMGLPPTQAAFRAQLGRKRSGR